MPKQRILIADDDTGLLTAMSCRLEHEGYTVFTTQDGYQALAIARRELPDLLILDINMPAGSGVSVFNRVHAIKELAHAPVIFITGNEKCSLPSTHRHTQVVKLIRKPFDSGTLLATVRECLNDHHDAQETVYVI